MRCYLEFASGSFKAGSAVMKLKLWREFKLKGSREVRHQSQNLQCLEELISLLIYLWEQFLMIGLRFLFYPSEALLY